jgi:hypothetical protein
MEARLNEASERMYIWRVTRDARERERENILTTQLSATDISGRDIPQMDSSYTTAHLSKHQHHV